MYVINSRKLLTKSRLSFSEYLWENLLGFGVMRYCPMCNSRNVHIITPLNYAMFDDLGMSGQMNLASCKDCCFLYNQTFLEEADFSEYYVKNQYYLDARTSGSGGTSDQDFARYSRIYEEIRSVMPENNHFVILDYGCGKGGMLSWLSSNIEAELIGIEPSASCRKYARELLRAKMFETLDQFKVKANIVILSHVLEHVLNPRVLLDRLKQSCSDNALVYIEVPRAESYILERVDWREFYFEHINHFTERSLNTMVMAAGFEVLKKGVVHFFSEDLNSPDCLFVVARPDTICRDESVSGSCEDIRIGNLPAVKIISEVLMRNKRISVWGISQYTQLILGSYPGLMERVEFLFDSSPAKIGRKIGGIEILPSTDLSHLGKDDVLLIPGSKYADEMVTHLQQINFTGQSVCY